MVGKRKIEADPIPEPRGTAQVVNHPDSDPGPGTNDDRMGTAQLGFPTDEQGRLPNDPEYTGPGTYAQHGERMDIPEGKVAYVGPYGAREISGPQWRGAGVEDMPNVRWDETNKYMIDKNVFTEAAIRVVQQDPSFRVT
jgi:hypothetical protein